MNANRNGRRPKLMIAVALGLLALPTLYVLASGPLMRLAFIDDALPGDPVWMAYEPLFEAAEDVGLDEALGAYVALWLPDESGLMIPTYDDPNRNAAPVPGNPPEASPAIYISEEAELPTAGSPPPSDVKPASFDNSTTPPEGPEEPEEAALDSSEPAEPATRSDDTESDDDLSESGSSNVTKGSGE